MYKISKLPPASSDSICLTYERVLKLCRQMMWKFYVGVSSPTFINLIAIIKWNAVVVSLCSFIFLSITLKYFVWYDNSRNSFSPYTNKTNLSPQYLILLKGLNMILICIKNPITITYYDFLHISFCRLLLKREKAFMLCWMRKIKPIRIYKYNFFE